MLLQKKVASYELLVFLGLGLAHAQTRVGFICNVLEQLNNCSNISSELFAISSEHQTRCCAHAVDTG